MLSTTQGIYSESIFITECIKRDIEICSPIVDKNGYDFIVDNGEWVRVQVKSSSREDKSGGRAPGTYKVSCRKGASSKAYSEGDYDYLAVYLIPEDTWYIIPFALTNGSTIRINTRSEKDKFANYKWNFDLLRAGSFNSPPKRD